MKLSRFFFRCWYYFRTGFGTYVSLPLGFFSMVTTIYYLAIKNIPYLELIFPHFSLFLVVAIVFGGPLAVFAGWLHVRRSAALSSEIEASAEMSPYNFKLPPGHLGEVMYGALYQILKTVDLGKLPKDRREQIESLLKKFEILFSGGYVGRPRVKPS